MIKKQKLIRNTPEEDLATQRGIDADPDNPEVTAEEAAAMIPHAVVSATVDGATPECAWRDHLGLTQQQAATRAGLRVADYGVAEASPHPDKESLRVVAFALGISVAQLDV